MCHTDHHQFISEQSKIAEQLGLVKPQVARASLISFSEKKVQRKKLRMLQTKKKPTGLQSKIAREKRKNLHDYS